MKGADAGELYHLHGRYGYAAWLILWLNMLLACDTLGWIEGVLAGGPVNLTRYWGSRMRCCLNS